MILDTLKSANGVILDSVNAANDKHAVEKYKNQLMALNISTNQLGQFLKLISLFNEKNIIKKFVSADVKTSLTQAVDNCGEKTADHSLDEGTVTALKNAITSLRGELDSAWKAVADGRCTPIIESVTESSTNGKNYLFQVDIAQKSPLKPINRAFLSFSHFSPDPDLLHKSRGVFPLGKYSKMPDLLSISRLFFSLREPVSCLDFLPILVFSYTVTIKKT